jgi:hypothetical protein
MVQAARHRAYSGAFGEKAAESAANNGGLHSKRSYITFLGHGWRSGGPATPIPTPLPVKRGGRKRWSRYFLRLNLMAGAPVVSNF